MPRWVYHPSLRKLRSEVSKLRTEVRRNPDPKKEKKLRDLEWTLRMARKVFWCLDKPGPGHSKWRRHTHNLDRAMMIGYILGGGKGIRLALSHVAEDMVFDKLRELGVPEEIAQKIVYRLFS